MAFAQVDAKRGEIHWLTDEAYSLFAAQPKSCGRFDTYTLAEEIMKKGDTQAAFEVAESVDLSGLSTIDKADHALLLERIRFSEGDGYNIEQAREHIRHAGRLAGTLPDTGTRTKLEEKILSVRTINELWRVGCDPASAMAGGLKALVDATPHVPESDPVRVNTLQTIAAVSTKCQPPA
ncbi:MAG: hypothetical protein AB1Z21_11340 [Synechococcaceae cyanobacterium]